MLSERGIFRVENHASPATRVSLLERASAASEDYNVRVGRANPLRPVPIVQTQASFVSPIQFTLTGWEACTSKLEFGSYATSTDR